LLVSAQADVAFISMEGLAVSDNGQDYSINTLSQNQCLLPVSERRQLSVEHCSGMLSRDGTAIYTAAHCIRELLTQRFSMTSSNRADWNLLNLRVGDDVVCDDDSEFRFVFGGAALEFVDHVRESAVRRCESIIRLSEDVVKISLTDGVQRGEVVAPEIIFPDDPQRDSFSLEKHRRVTALGFGHRAVLLASSDGYAAQNSFCADTFSKNGIDGVVEGDVGTGSYLCVSTDTITGMSGGPAFAHLDDGRLAWIGVVSRAIDAGVNVECGNWTTSSISDKPSDLSREFNLIATLPN
jgi:Trypsin